MYRNSFIGGILSGGSCVAFCRNAGLACLAMLLLLLPTIAPAQSATGTITGFITDASGANVPDATVTVTETATKIVHPTKSNGAGVFTVPQLSPGVYDVQVERAGFSKAVRSAITIEVNQTVSLTIPLAVGSAADTVQVSGSAPLLDIDHVSLGTVIGAEEITDLPLNGRQFIQLLQLVPGVAPTTVSQNGSQIQIGAGAVNPAIGGATNRSNLFFINGVFATNPTYTIYAVSPPSDVIQEFQEQSHASDAEFGGATGGSVSISTKAGTNKFHGSGYEFIKNDALDAVSYFQNKYWYGNPDGSKPRYQQNQFGATLGGPIWKNKVFFFGNYEGYRVASQTSPANVGLPTEAELGGDFSALLGTTTIYDPATYNASTGTIQAFQGNIIPTTRLNTQLINVVKAFLPKSLPTVPYQLATNPNNPSQLLGYNFTNRQSATTTQNQYGLRVDYAITPKDLLYGDYFYELGEVSAPGGLPSNPFVNITGGKNTGVNYVHTFSSTLVAQATVGWLRATSPGYAVQPNAQALFDSGGFGAGFASHPGGVSMPFVPVIENDVFGINSGEGGDFDTVWQYSGSVQKQAGRHSLKFGAALYKATLNTNYAQDVEYYNAQSTAIPNNTTNPGGEEFAGMFLGLPTGSFAQAGNSGGFLHETVLGFYAQDTWKVNPRFTVNYGLRWDYTAPVTDDGNRLSGFDQYKGEWYIPKGDVDAPAVLPSGVYIAGDHIAPNDYKNFSPRLGLAFLLDPKTSLRAGAGIFFDSWAGNIQATQAARGSWPSGAYLNSSNTNINGLSSPAVTAQNPFPGQSPIVAATPYPGGGTFLDTKWKNAYALSYNLELEHQLTNSQTFSIIYAGSGTSRSSIQVPFNEPITLGPTASEVFPYPNMYPGGFNVIQSIAHLSYNSLQSKYEKRFGNGLGIHGAFTWSKDIDVGCADFWEGCSIQNPANLKSERGDSAKSEPIVITSSVVYKLPFGKGKDHLNKGGIASSLAGGWQVNGIFQHNVSPPFNATLTFDNANSFIGSERYNIAGHTSGPKQRDNYYNAKAFVLPTQYTYGNGGRNDLRPPDFTDIDASVFRTFTLYRDVKFEFRSEFFNVLNHTNFGGANLSCNNELFNADGTCDTTSQQGMQVNANFNKIRSAGAAREIQFAGKITF
jgi:outer membrane receptor protein involved in Fe transport